MMRRALVVVVAAALGVLAGAGLTMAVQRDGRAPSPGPGRMLASPPTTPETPSTFLVWVPRGLPRDFASAVGRLPKIAATTVVAEDDTWLRRSWDAGGQLVDRPPAGYRIPIDTAAVDPATFAAFVPAADRPDVAALSEGAAILGASSAALRGLGPGSVMDVGGDMLRVAAVLPDQLVGAAELVVSDRVGARIGVQHDRYMLVQPSRGRRMAPDVFRARIAPMLPASLGVDRVVQVRAPGDTPFFRAGDAVLPPVLVKSLFGEFAARRGRRPGTLRIDPAWTAAHIETTRVPLLGRVTCNRQIVPQLTAAMRQVRRRAPDHAVRSYQGCFVPRYIGWSNANMLSYHSWGIAFDINAGENVRGETPQQDPRLVRILSRNGFEWGGTWIVPDGNHFEFHRTAPVSG
jgi:D-alanyl-D-alanine carboxypeptidase